MMLRHQGHEVREADSGISGLRSFHENIPDLVITDIIMPDMEGVETISEIKKLRADMRIIAMSGGGRIKNTDFLKLASAAGANVILNKPFDNKELNAAVAAATKSLTA
jgi:DNA-binding response OmpR family regulator